MTPAQTMIAKAYDLTVRASLLLGDERAIHVRQLGRKPLYLIEPSLSETLVKAREEGLYDTYALLLTDYTPLTQEPVMGLTLEHREGALLTDDEETITRRLLTNLSWLASYNAEDQLLKDHLIDKATILRDDDEPKYAILDNGRYERFDFKFNNRSCIHATTYDKRRTIDLLANQGPDEKVFTRFQCVHDWATYVLLE